MPEVLENYYERLSELLVKSDFHEAKITVAASYNLKKMFDRFFAFFWLSINQTIEIINYIHV